MDDGRWTMDGEDESNQRLCVTPSTTRISLTVTVSLLFTNCQLPLAVLASVHWLVFET
jgi:hypothetical protein